MCRKLILSVSLVLVLGLLRTSTAEAADTNIVGYWKFDEGAGIVAADSSGYGNDGTLNGNVKWVAGRLGSALDFDGNGDFVEVPHSPSLSITNEITIAAWTYMSANASGEMAIVSKGGWSANDLPYELTETPNDVIFWQFYDNEGRDTCSPNSPPVNEWHHIAGTYDGKVFKCYIDGQLGEEWAYVGKMPQNTASVTIGRRSRGGTFFNGIIDDVRIYARALAQEEIQQVMIGIPPGLASNPIPADGTEDVPRDVTLGWTPGEFAPPVNGHKVYLSENFSDVNDGVGGITQDSNSYAPAQRLDFGTTYYWRVDEVNGPPDYTVYKGDVWSFTTEPVGYPIENITATASSSHSADMGPEKTINGSGLNADDLHSKEPADMWLSSAEPLGAWIKYEFDKIYKLHQMWVWNSNQMIESLVGFGFKNVTIEYSTNGTDYTALGTTVEFAQAPGTDGYAHNTTVDLAGVAAKYVRLTAKSAWGSIMPQFGLSEVRFFYIPIRAREPSPEPGATDVNVDVTLGFRAGREAAQHDVYLSTDEQAVVGGTAPVTTVTTASYGPLSLDLGKTYYWRVDEVNEVETPATWKGELWNFTTQEYYVVDDFESYNDLDTTDPASNRIFNTWLDGYGTTTNGSIVGYDVPPFAEQSIVHGGKQAMPLFYNNSGTARYSEATMTLSPTQNWTIKGIEALSLWFKGNPAGFVEAPAGTYMMNAAGVDIWGTADQFRFAYKQLTGDGSIIARVESVELVPGSNDWVKAGVMIRETLEPGSKFAAVYMTPTRADGTPTRGCRYQARTSTGGSATSDSSVATAAQQALKVPYWVKMERVGNKFNAYYSADGVSWQAMVWNPQTISMSANVYIGLALTSHSAGVTTEAVFSNVSTTGAVTGQFTQQVIGAAAMPTNSPASMYVALASGGAPAVIYHDNTSASQIGSWTEWKLNLQSFVAKGVNLTRVNTITIGFGDKTNPQPGGSGVVYFDDIRLYPPK